MRLASLLLASLVLLACGRSRVVSPIPVADAGPDAPPNDDGGTDAGRDGGRDASAGSRAATLTESCGPADGFAWEGTIADPAWACGEDRSEAQHFTLYLHTSRDPEGVYRWTDGGFGDQVSFCPGGRAPCELSSEGEAQVFLPPDASPSIRLRAVFRSLTVDEVFDATICPAVRPCL
ncbi:MAG: hypothetical protein KF901_29510 [Myxococcales bacterium]|nr:hypothetical protein [Myxococcales bacterium]